MRTIGVRSAPIPAPRPAPCPASCSKQPPDPPKPLPRTKFLQKNKLESPATVTTQVIPTSLPPPHARPVRPKCIPTRIPPPKPPRSPSTGDNFGQDATSWPRRPGLMEVLSFTGPATAASTIPAARRQFLPTVTPTRPAPQGRGGSTGAIPTRRAPRPRLQPLSLPPPSTAIPTTVVSSTTAPRVPSRPSAAQLAASRTPAGASGPRPAPPSAVGLRTASNVQSPVCSTEDFEGSCRDVFRNTRTAKELAGRGKHMQAANHYQKALTALDRVLRAQVLSLTHHEPTRQRLFLMQQEVFNLRKEALNGFADAQAAVRTPPGLCPVTAATPGAPPSYDDVLKEDSRRLRDDPPRPSRQPSAQETSSPSHPLTASHGSDPRPCPAPTMTSATHRPSSRIRSHSSGDSKIEKLVDVRDTTSGEPTAYPPVASSRTSLKPILISAMRPKSSYHPLSQLVPPMSLPPDASSHVSLPPPLLPVSIPPASLPAHSLPHPAFNPDPVLDEVVVSQMRVLHKYGSDKCLDVLADTPFSPSLKKQLPLNKGNLQERKEKDGIASKGGDVPLLESPVKASGSTVQVVKDEAKDNGVSSVSSLDDPFLGLDPFPPIKPQSGDNEMLLPEETQDAPTLPAVSGAYHTNSQAFPYDLTYEASLNVDQKDSLSPLETQSPADNLGDSILEALDFAITPMAGHKRVSPQHSRDIKTVRSYSEENLLDSSHNTFEAILYSSRDRHASRASIIEEFDPLVTFHISQDHKQEEMYEEEVFKPKEREAWKVDKGETMNITPPKPVPRRARQGSCAPEEHLTATEGDIYGSPPDYYTEGGAIALREKEEVEEEGVGDRCTTSRFPGAHYVPDGVKQRASYSSSEDSSSMYSVPPDYCARVSSNPASPLYPYMYPEEEEEEEEEEAGVDVGRSAFYLPLASQDEGRRRNLLSIHEGVKIFFIHTDGVVTSPWKKPFLAVSRDASKDRLFGAGMVMCVGNSLWVCELHKKLTLVLKTHTDCYIFNEVAGKPECKAVAIRVPSGVRRSQQELLSNILQQNTLLEEERPKGITKVISKGASSAAVRMNKLVEDQSMTPSQPFVRRNSIRALKGVTRRLNNIAEKTGSTLKELPEDYQTLQEAADTLAFARSAKMIQYI